MIAKIDGQIAGFKLGYAIDSSCFYSWVGAVEKKFRRIGVASLLMNSQHQWCREQGYLRIETKCQNQFQEMLILNLKNNFRIIGTHLSENDKIKILLQKQLSGIECVF